MTSVRYNNLALLPTLMLLSLTALTFWLDQTSKVEPDQQGPVRHDPDYFVDNFTVKRFDSAGKLYQTLNATHMLHYADDDSTEVTKPRMTYHTQRPTVIIADKALLIEGGKTVELESNVKIVHDNPNSPPTQITSSRMTLLPDDEVARTSVPVTITQGASVLHGQGLEANNKTQISVLHGRINGTIAPQTK